MSLSAGIVGLPNVGKSTLFNTLSSGKAESGNYPFCTIDPNVGIIEVPDPRLDTIAEHIETEEVIPAVVEMHDIAGLVEGASEGEGLGNKFLANIRETDAIIHVVRCFENDDVVHVEGSVDPVRDVEIIETELILADLQTLETRLEKAKRAAKSQEKEDIEKAEAIEKAWNALNEGIPARAVDFTENELDYLKDSHLLTMKPVLYVANVDEDDLDGDSEHVQALREVAEERGSEVMTVCAEIEAELADLDEEGQREMLDGLGIDEPALHNLIRKTYELLGLESFFTAGPKEIRAWTVEQGSTAPEAAGVIHSDFQDNFIRAEVYTVEDLDEYEDEAALRDEGKIRLEGKDYIVQDGDIMFFRHGG